MNVFQLAAGAQHHADRLMNAAKPVLGLGLRLWMFSVFFKSGLTKIQSWETTRMLFEYEYRVPLLAPGLAAGLATAAELVLPVLLLVGLGNRTAALGLWLLNLVAVTSYPDISVAGVKDHLLWGTVLLVLLVHGPGRLSIDQGIIKDQRRAGSRH